MVFALMMASATAENLTKWNDPYCNTWSTDGSCCLKCSDRYYKDCNGRCQKVSDFCKEWDQNTGDCTCCYPSYGNPVNGKCSPTPCNDVKVPPKHDNKPEDCE